MAFDVADWNLLPNMRFFVRLREGVDVIEVDLFNTKADLDGDVNRVAFGTPGFGIGVQAVLTADTTLPSTGVPISKFNVDLEYDLKVTGGTGDPEVKLQIGPFTDLPPVEDALLVSEAMIQARATVELNRGTHSAFHRTLQLDEHYATLEEADFVSLTLTKRGLVAETDRIDEISIESVINEDGRLELFDVLEVTVYEDVVR